ncbi:hypothetical protein FACS189451_08890 [Bacteroidia bacterium]|nr:hypothetical protein FACS189451_08890 [Bacteroidia bacterium]
MAVYIDQINSKSIRIKKIINGFIVDDIKTDATYNAIISNNMVLLRDMAKTSISILSSVRELFINGNPAPSNTDELKIELAFIGNAYSSANSDEQIIRQIVKDELEALNLPDGTITSSDINSLS